MINNAIISPGLRRFTIGNIIIDLPESVPIKFRKQGEIVYLVVGEFPENLPRGNSVEKFQVVKQPDNVMQTGSKDKSKRKLSPRLTPEQVAEVERQLDENIAPYLIAKNMGITKAQVYHVSNKKKGK